MVVGEAQINNIMGGIENTGSVRLHNHKRKLKQRFDIIKKLGQGTYGKVQLGINKETGQEVAIKTIKKSKIETEADLIRIRREIQIMSSVQHPNIIHIYEVFENREKMVLVMEYAAGGELYDYLSERKVLVEEEARRIFRQISTACYYCHKHKICHRDLKLENILLDENRNAKIADFGLSNVFDDQRLLSTFCGSPLYASPEIVKGTPYHGPEVDCWSLGVLLYTLVYGAMPFDGSNFKRLVKQISQGDYFEPKKPSPASPLILEMLTVNPKNRANIEKICAHWWVNETYDESCLDISEDLANQTPVRLDLLLSLNPPPPQLEGEQLVVTGEAPISEEQLKSEPGVPCTRSQSVGSLMNITNPAERRIKDLIAEELKATPKRKLETTLSTDRANVDRKDKIVKEHTVADISVHGNNLIKEESEEDIKMTDLSINKKEETNDSSLQGAACAEIVEEDSKKLIDTKPQLKIKKTMSNNLSNKILEEINENPSQENLFNDKNKENTKAISPIKDLVEIKSEIPKSPSPVKDEVIKAPIKKKIIKKKILGDKNEIAKPKKIIEKPMVEEKLEEEAEPPSKPMERRQSRIFEQAEKFQNLIASSESKTVVPEKPKKIIIPGVSVGGFKQEFERKASLTSTSPPKLRNTTSKKLIIEDKSIDIEEPTIPIKVVEIKPEVKKIESKIATPIKETIPIAVESPMGVDDDRKIKLKNAVSIISSALDKEGTRKSKSRPCMGRKPPVPFGVSGRSASGSIGLLTSPSNDGKRLLKMQLSDNRPFATNSSTPEQVSYTPEVVPEESQTSSAEITLKSATLPRRKMTKAEIQLDYPKPKAATMEFKTEMAHNIQNPPKLITQRSEVIVPVNASTNIGFRSSSMEPENRATTKERIIPIAFERPTPSDERELVQSPPMKPPVPRFFQSQKSNTSQRSNSLSRQSTQESDTETSGDPIRKSPREYIIPIAVEGGGYVTPRAGSLEPSETSSTITNSSRKTSSSKFGRPRRMMSFLDRDGSEDESPFTSLHRHSSFGKDSDTEGDTRKDAFHMHRLRSSRPRKSTMEHTDSVSSEEDNDDDDGFEFLTAENLFSTLLSRVRDLTTRLNVDDGARPGFPNSRLLSHFDHGSNFWNRMEPLGSSRNSPLGRQFSRERNMNSTSSIPWRRSVSRDLASDIETVFNDPNRTTPNRTASLPRGDKTKENLNLTDLNLKKLKLTEEDALALSYLTPGLSKRIQKQLFASLPAAEAKKITRTLSMREENPNKEINTIPAQTRRSVDRISSTLPRKFSFDKQIDFNQNNTINNDNQNELNKSKNTSNSKENMQIRNLPSRDSSAARSREISLNRDLTSPFSDRSCRSESYDSRNSELKPRRTYLRASSLREPNDFKTTLRSYSLRSPDSSISEISPIKDELISGPENDSLSKFIHHTNKFGEVKNKNDVNAKPVRKISRFLRPDFFDVPKEESVVVKEKKEREMETQKVLKEIRDKRIKNRISMRRERSLSREKSLEVNKIDEKCVKNITETNNTKNYVSKILNNNEQVEQDAKNELELIKCKELVQALTELKTSPSNNLVEDTLNNNSDTTQILLRNVSDNIKNIESNVLINPEDKVPIIKKGISKLIRPKSYPAENGVIKTKSNEINDESKRVDVKPKISKLKKIVPKEDKPKNKFFQSIEKKFEKLRTFNTSDTSEEKKLKEEKKSCVENAIKKLRENSVPKNLDNTESTLIKRAVSVEDFSNVKNKTLQPSRKSVTKILSLFKKYEDKKDDVTEATCQLNKNEMLKNINESNIPSIVKCEPERIKSPDSSQSDELIRPKSLLLDKFKRYNGSKSDDALTLDVKNIKKLPTNSFIRRSLNIDANSNPEVPKKDEITTNNSNGVNNTKLDRNLLKLDLETAQDLNRNSYTTDESSTFLSPCDDISNDSWSVCSDFHHTQDLQSPLSPNGACAVPGYNSGDENESVIDRIRRKSFYTRFNEKKKPRKSLAGNYKDLDLYKDLNQKPLRYSNASAGNSSNANTNRSKSIESNDTTSYKPYTRCKSLMNDYVNVPNRYQTYNPRKSNIQSLYTSSNSNANEDEGIHGETATGTYRKYSYSPNTSRLGSRSSRSPSSEYQYLVNPSSENTSNSTSDNILNMSLPTTEHAV